MNDRNRGDPRYDGLGVESGASRWTEEVDVGEESTRQEIRASYITYAFTLNDTYLALKYIRDRKLRKYVNQPVVRWLERLWYPQPTRVQILVLAFYGDFVNLKMICRLSLSEVLIGVGCACVRS